MNLSRCRSSVITWLARCSHISSGRFRLLFCSMVKSVIGTVGVDDDDDEESVGATSLMDVVVAEAIEEAIDCLSSLIDDDVDDEEDDSVGAVGETIFEIEEEEEDDDKEDNDDPSVQFSTPPLTNAPYTRCGWSLFDIVVVSVVGVGVVVTTCCEADGATAAAMPLIPRIT
jgi:hypothetical protein